MDDPIFLLDHLTSIGPVDDKITQLDTVDNAILQYFCKNPGGSAYQISSTKADIFTTKVLRRRINYEKIRRHVNKLSKMGLIKIRPEKPSQHRRKSGKLSIRGLFFLILRNRILPYDITNAILKNYADNIIFELLIYPYVGLETLSKINDFHVLTQTSLFLYDCCKEIEDAVDLVKRAKSGRPLQPIFVWQHVPANKHGTNRLREFLKQKFNLNWLDYVHFEKIENENSLIASYRSNSVIINLDKKRGVAALKINRQKKYEFIIKKYSDDWYSIEASDITMAEQTAALSILLGTQQRVPSFIFNLASKVVVDSRAAKILSEDKKFMESLHKTKVKFDNQYNILRRKSTS